MHRKLILAGGVLAVTMLLAACGGGSDNKGVYFPPIVENPTPPVTGPETDSAVDSFIGFVRQLVANSTESGEPVAVTQYDPPPTNERLEPVATP
ncbi:MAG: hypothetical protein EOO24_07505 [Comamonadaceae bacterium]|nr:MAG: hypothetical protein EOO24_07505 [Comamonadaceae bacterium]